MIRWWLEMPVRVLVVAFASVALSMTAHIVWWRVKRPRADIGAIFGVFLVAPALAYASMAVAAALHLIPMTPAQLLLSLGLHAAVSCAYVQTYPAMQAQSPTLYILLAVGRAPGGLDDAGVARSLDPAALVGERAEDLLRNGLVVRQGGRIVASRAGHLMARSFAAYRRWLGLSRLGG